MLMRSLLVINLIYSAIRHNNPPRGGLLSFGATVRESGFTLIELVAVMVVIGILAVVILPRWDGTSGFDERGFRDNVVAGLRYAHKSAVASRRTVCASFSSPPAQVTFRISSANGAIDCSTGATLIGPNGSALVVTATGKAVFSSLPSNIVFDAAGRPVVPASINVSGLSAAQVITVEAETGYVH